MGPGFCSRKKQISIHDFSLAFSVPFGYGHCNESDRYVSKTFFLTSLTHTWRKYNIKSTLYNSYSNDLATLFSRMMQSLGNEATKSEDAFVLFQETQESVRVSFLNCLLDFAGT